MIELYSKVHRELPNRFVLRLARTMRQAIETQARAELPNECCGILAGRIVDGSGEPLAIVDASLRFPLVNEAASPREFFSDAKSLIEAHVQMRNLDLEVVAIYHSHPATPASPSVLDRERHYYPDAMSLIISLENETPDLLAWWLTEGGAEPAEIVDA
jgi:proteasome lid subunit RPN8/RPN11